MLKHFINISLRRLLRNKISQAFNITAFAIGITCSIFSLLYVYHESNFEIQHTKKDHIYRIACETDMSGNITQWAPAPAPLGPDLADVFPEIKGFTRVMIPFYSNNFNVRIKDDDHAVFTDKVFRVDSSFVDIFDFELLHGDQNTLLVNPDGVVISEELALSFFGKTDVLGEFIDINDYEFIVEGVVKRSYATHLDFNVLIPWHAFDWGEEWLSADSYTYVLLDPQADINAFEKELVTYASEKLNDIGKEIDAKVKLIVQPFDSIHLHSHLHGEIPGNSNYAFMMVFFFVGVLFIFIATLNYVNFAVAGFDQRIKELGIKKAMGVSILELRYQFGIEGAVFLCISLVISLLLIFLTLPAFNDLFDTQIQLGLITTLGGLVAFVLFVTFIWILITFFPLYFYSKFTTQNLLRSSTGNQSNLTRYRKPLVSFQVASSIVVAILSIIIANQFYFIVNKDLGFEKENIVMVSLPAHTTSNIKTFKDALQGRSEILAISGSNYLPTVPFKDEFRFMMNGSEVTMTLQEIYVDFDFFELFNISVNEGRPFEETRASDMHEAFIVNKEAAKKFHWDNPIGQEIEAINDFKKGKVIGQMDNVYLYSLNQQVEPVIIHLTSGDYSGNEVMYVKIAAGRTTEALRAIKDVYAKLYTHAPFTYTFFDNELMKLYGKEQKLSIIFKIGLIIIIYLSAIGLYSLSYSLATKKLKEISMRRIFGATSRNLILVQLKEYIAIIALANLAAWPLAYWLSAEFLEQFVFKVGIQWQVFITVSICSVLVIVLTIGMNLLRVAFVNPILVLRQE